MSGSSSPRLVNVQGHTESQEDESGCRIIKRKRPSRPRATDRKKVSRACDACKEKKVRCAGTQPCPRCISNNLRCHYNAEHRRGNPAPPQPGPGISSPELNRTSTIPNSESHSPAHLLSNIGIRNPIVPPLPSQESPNPPLEDPEQNRFDNDYIGPTSGLAFLSRSQRRFQQDFIESRSSNVCQSSQTSIFSYGDAWISDHDSDFTFPDRNETKYLLQEYFDFAMPTYRFLRRDTVEAWLENMHTEIENDSSGEIPILDAEKASIFLILATAKLYNDDVEKDFEFSSIYYVAAERLLTKETGKVTLKSVQARLTQCIYLLASSRVNQAWYTFGTTAQLIIALGLHRRQVYQPGNTKHSNDTLEYRKRVFWSAYTLDRYLSVILGRPRIFRDEDIDQPLPNQSDIDVDFTSKIGARSRNQQSVEDGPIFHARLAKIIGGISNDLYPTHRNEDGGWLQSAERWTAELKAWKESLPAFLDPSKVDPSMLISIFQRQSTVLRLAYAHALILANRPSLLSNFADLAKRTERLTEKPSRSVDECINAAMIVVDTVTGLIEEKKMRQSFWFTHYISFCAISALYVYTIQQCLPAHTMTSESSYLSRPETHVFEAAKRFQERIEETTTKSSPFRKYNIILDELKNEVLRHLKRQYLETDTFDPFLSEQTAHVESTEPMVHSMSIIPPAHGISGNNLAFNPGNFPSSAAAPGTDTSQHISLNPLQSQHYTSNHLTMEGDQAYDISSGAVDFPGLQGGMMGWSEFDSCALTWPDVYGDLDQGYAM
ncbi:fungal-specific transcription factor domain-containing protein [Rhexocercosporidium sp. MPI-PUGE-AT-0058]|nr:fungal-specific transcription factor domain-containing protein [Rhexocercosporidium sp. MPI-PUGE-AT-0058]